MISPAWPSDHFSREETTFSSTASRLGIDNTPKTVEIERNIVKAAHYLDDIRDLLKAPINIHSWYRCPELNEMVHGVKNSAHLTGWAIDFVAPKFGSPSEIFQYLALRNDIHFDQLILEFNSWVHISFDPQWRGQKLIFNGKSYREV